MNAQRSTLDTCTVVSSCSHNEKSQGCHVYGCEIDDAHPMVELEAFTSICHFEGYIFHVAPAMQEPARGRVTEVLPALQSLFSKEPAVC